MKKNYEIPSIEILALDMSDIITTSSEENAVLVEDDLI